MIDVVHNVEEDMNYKNKKAKQTQQKFLGRKV